MQSCPCYRAVLERCSSGLRGTPGKRVYSKRVSGVRISFSPQTEKENQRQVHLNADFLFRFAPPRRRRREMSERQQTKSRRKGGARGRLRKMPERQLTKSPREGGARGHLREMSERQRTKSRREGGAQDSLRTRPVISDEDLLNHRRLRVIWARYQESFRTTCMPQFGIYY